MAIETINLGNYANDGTGDDLRTAFQKVNDNFVTLNNLASKLESEPSPKLGGNLNLNGHYIYNGDIHSTVNGYDIEITAKIMDLIFSQSQIVVDIGDITDPLLTKLDFGTFNSAPLNNLDFGPFVV